MSMWTSAKTQAQLRASRPNPPGNNNKARKPTDFSALQIDDDEENDSDDEGESTSVSDQTEQTKSDASPPSTSATTDSSDEAVDVEEDDESDQNKNAFQVAGPKQKYFSHEVKPIIRSNAHAPLYPHLEWRATMGTGVGLQSNYQPPQHRMGGTRHTVATRPTNFQPAPALNGVPEDDITEGAILFHGDMVMSYTDDVKEELKDLVVEAPNGDIYIQKSRYWYVIGKDANHWVEVPIYTYEDKGLQNKPNNVKKEHIGIRPKHIKTKDYKKQNQYDPVEITRMKDPNEKLSENSFIHFTQLRSSNYNAKIRVVGYTTGQSIAAVNNLRRQFGC